MKVVYVAGPYRAPTHWGVVQNIRRAEEVGLEVAKLGVMPCVPHLASGSFGGEMPEEFWLEGTMDLLRRCDAVVLVPGWRESRGTLDELCEAGALKIPVFYSPATLGRWLGREAK